MFIARSHPAVFELVAVAQGQTRPDVSAHIAECTACLHLVILAVARARPNEANEMLGYLSRTRGDA